MTFSRHHLRRILRQRRRALPAHVRRRAQVVALARLRRLPVFRRARRVGIYCAVNDEIDPAALLAVPGKQFRLPVIRGATLRFAPVTRKPHRRNDFGIPEPPGPSCGAGALDLVIVPLLAFDACGNRLGMGGGFYDRSFAFRRRRPSVGPKLVGLAFGCQQCPALPAAAWDVPLDAVVTERGVVTRNMRCAIG